MFRLIASSRKNIVLRGHFGNFAKIVFRNKRKCTLKINDEKCSMYVAPLRLVYELPRISFPTGRLKATRDSQKKENNICPTHTPSFKSEKYE